MITQNELQHRFDYHDSGWLIRKSTGKPLGFFKERYIKAKVDGVTYYAHQLIFLWHFGYIPDGTDHVDRDGFNNRIENLRACTQSQNSGNGTYSEMRGIQKHGRKFRVRIATDDGKIELGSYETLEEAIVARNAGYQEYFGEFFRA